MVFTRTKAIKHLAGRKMQCPSQMVFLILAWRHDLLLHALRHPNHPDLREEVNIKFIRKDHYLMRLQVFGMKPNANQTLDPVRVIIFGYQLGAFPYPAHLMEPAPHGFCRHLNAVFDLEPCRESGTTSAGAAPAIGTRGRFE